MKRVYLATSYTWKSKLRDLPVIGNLLNNLVMVVRYWRVTKATAILIKSHLVNIFSPITHSHHIPKWIPDRLNTHTFWLWLDFDWIDTCDEMWVYMQPGWKESYGVAKEIDYCKLTGKKIRFFDYKTYEEILY